MYAFWACGSLVLYPYAGYPVFLWFLSRWGRRKSSARERTGLPPKENGELPLVTMLISVYNEENVIDEKIRNTLNIVYPESLLEIVVISDGSTDQTEAIVSRYGDRGIRLMRYEGRIGKTACLNRTIPHAKGEILLFSDADSMYHKEAIRNIAETFSDPEIGCVTGYTRYRRDGKGEGTRSIGLYALMELMAKRLESSLGSCVGADGAIFAIRKDLYTPLEDDDINDLVIPLSVVRQRFRCVLDEKAWCTERGAGDIREEYHRQTRITNRALRAIFRNADLFNPFRAGIYAWFLVSHKLMKYLVPFFLIGFFSSNIFLARSGIFYATVLIVQSAFIAAAIVSGRNRNTVFSIRAFSIGIDFLLINAAVLQGWWRYFRNERFTTWSPTRR